MFSKIKAQLQSQVDEARKIAEEESKERQTLLGKYKNVEHALDGMREQLAEESGAKDDLIRQVNKACQESDMWRQKFESEGLAKAEELEMTSAEGNHEVV